MGDTRVALQASTSLSRPSGTGFALSLASDASRRPCELDRRASLTNALRSANPSTLVSLSKKKLILSDEFFWLGDTRVELVTPSVSWRLIHLPTNAYVC